MRPGGFSAARGRRLIAVLAAGVLALAAAGCGGDDDLAPEVPGPPADVVIPESAEAPTSAAVNGELRPVPSSATLPGCVE